MRFSTTLFLLSALPALPVFARMNQLASRTSHDHPAIARRQYTPARTDLADICASIDISSLLKVSALGLVEAGAAVEVHVCICITVVPIFVETDVRIKDFVDRVGEKNAVTSIRDMVRLLKTFWIQVTDQPYNLQIRTADSKQTCQFPQHSIPIVSLGSGCGICEYGCEETFLKRDDKCVCDASLFECNGKCAVVSGCEGHSNRTSSHLLLDLWIVYAKAFFGVVVAGLKGGSLTTFRR